MKNPTRWVAAASGLVLTAAFLASSQDQASAQPAPQDTDPPDHVVRLVFIHHSTGENWLADDNGGLGLALAENNYFVSDTNYGWGPESIGDRTDIPDWLEWFRGPETDRYMQALFAEDGQNSSYTRLEANPGGENEIVLFKSCFPNSNLEGNSDDPPAEEGGYSVGGAKYVYNQLLAYFKTRPDKLFVVITAPPVSDPSYAENARAFNQWLVKDWLNENEYPHSNVAVFDFYNVLTGRGHHHRIIGGVVEHTFASGRDTSAYPTEDDHPSRAGNRKATEEFVPLLNLFYQRWQESTAGAGGEIEAVNTADATLAPLTPDAEGASPQALPPWGAALLAAAAIGSVVVLAAFIVAVVILIRRRGT
ncbi:MAG: hypothetical protein A2Z30_04190 [Chloroflexi bacterium RBG_16_64_43]|nr:MAG: hypothetical protein A2Z30_04190 [Chloroflexi bacterium RBG_16_64_43]